MGRREVRQDGREEERKEGRKEGREGGMWSMKEEIVKKHHPLQGNSTIINHVVLV